jgi:hypothetical protein
LWAVRTVEPVLLVAARRFMLELVFSSYKNVSGLALQWTCIPDMALWAVATLLQILRAMRAVLRFVGLGKVLSAPRCKSRRATIRAIYIAGDNVDSGRVNPYKRKPILIDIDQKPSWPRVYQRAGVCLRYDQLRGAQSRSHQPI